MGYVRLEEQRGRGYGTILVDSNSHPCGCNCGWQLSIFEASLVAETLGQHGQLFRGGRGFTKNDRERQPSFMTVHCVYQGLK